MLLATHRVAPTTSSDCNRLYMQKKAKRSTPKGADEIAANTRFAAVSIMVRDRAVDMSKMTQDQADFIAQKNLANGKRTMKAYLWKVCGQEYDLSH